MDLGCVLWIIAEGFGTHRAVFEYAEEEQRAQDGPDRFGGVT